jgi:fluoroacetyl-CoA thioesterase
MTLAPGLTASVTLVVAEADTALALRSADVPVLGTPRVIALAEQASVAAIANDLPAGRTTVGYQVQLAHLTPTAVGGTVVAEATLEQVEGRRLTFRVSVNDARGLVAAGRITRVVVERARFLERAQNEGR